MTHAGSGRRTGLVLVLIIAGLMATATLSTLDHTALSRLDKTHDAQLNLRSRQINSRLAALERQILEISKNLDGVRDDAIATEREQLQARLEHVETTVKELASIQDLDQIHGRLSAIEIRTANLKRAPPSPDVHRPTERMAESAPTPPFIVIGTELRGGEQFVSIAPLDATSIAQLRLLRAGESEGDWLLESIEARSAQFRVVGRLQQIPIP